MLGMPARSEDAMPLVTVAAYVGDNAIGLGWRLHHDGPWLWHPQFGFPWGPLP
jgi:hypothetical protein